MGDRPTSEGGGAPSRGRGDAPSEPTSRREDAGVRAVSDRSRDDGAEQSAGRASLIEKMAEVTVGMASRAIRVVTIAGTIPLEAAGAMLGDRSQRVMRETGRYIRELREVAGLTLSELAGALDLRDRSLLEAIEAGTATISVELILRLAAVLARNDPFPVAMRLLRTYNPGVWKILDDWGLGRLPLQLEREREFVNVLRGRDVARKLSDAGYANVLEYTRAAFDMAVDFAARSEGIKPKPR
jgi:transcriptional regulator with XRE-family HTH domain